MINNDLVSASQLVQAHKDTRLKKAFELILFRQLLRLFRDYSNKYSRAIEARLSIPSLIFFRQKLEKILNAHYQIVADKFNANTVQHIGKPDNYDAFLRDLRTNIDIHSQLRLADSSQTIVETTQQDAIKAFENVKKEALVAGIVLTAAVLARKSRLKLNNAFSKRIRTIAITETQNPAEYAKFAEVFYLRAQGHVADPMKKWVTMDDDLVRAAHRPANGQVVSFNEPFNVGGEQLMFPGDQSLGASIWNVANCRCAVVFIF